MLGYKKGNKKLLTGQIPLHYPADRVYLDGDKTKTVQDKCASKTDLTNLDLTGTTNTTGSTIPIKKFFYLNGTLVRAKTAIANGATFTENTNYEVVSAGGLNALNAEVNKGKVTVVADGIKNRSQLLSELYGLIDKTKLTPKSVFTEDTNIFNILSLASNAITVERTQIQTNQLYSEQYVIVSSSSTAYSATVSSSGYTRTNEAGTVIPQGREYTIYY